MKQASQAEVKALAEKLLAPVIEGLREEIAQLAQVAGAYRAETQTAVQEFEKARKLMETERRAYGAKLEQAKNEAKAVYKTIQTAQQSSQDVLTGFGKAIEDRVKVAEEKAQIGADAAEDALEAMKAAENAERAATVNRLDIEELLKQVKLAAEEGQKQIREARTLGVVAVQDAVRKQEKRLDDYAQQMAVHVESVGDKLQKELSRLTKTHQENQRIALEIESKMEGMQSAIGERFVEAVRAAR